MAEMAAHLSSLLLTDKIHLHFISTLKKIELVKIFQSMLKKFYAIWNCPKKELHPELSKMCLHSSINGHGGTMAEMLLHAFVSSY